MLHQRIRRPVFFSPICSRGDGSEFSNVSKITSYDVECSALWNETDYSNIGPLVQ